LTANTTVQSTPKVTIERYYYYDTRLTAFSRTTWVSPYQKGKTSLDLYEAGDDGVLGHQLDHMQTICTSLQTDNDTDTSSLNFQDALPDAQPTLSL